MKFLGIVLCVAFLALQAKSAQAVCGYEVRKRILLPELFKLIKELSFFSLAMKPSQT